MKLIFKIIFLFIILLTINCPAGSNVENIFDLAKKSVCRDVAEDVLKNPLFTPDGRPTGKAGYFISQLNALTATPFPYRFEITNGYKEGFVYYALLGYLNEMNGKIPIAYRCYQNSLACIDEDKSFSHPLPRAEIYLAIGRTCLAAGRYMDAKDWLDNAFLEAGDNKQLQAAIDRVGIQRANEIGDYPEIIFLFQHLEEVSRASQRGLKSKMPHWEMRLTKPELANYAQILFYSRKDREGFSKLLEGISKLGIDNNLGVKDPLVDKFLNNIMRADDDEVKYFYDLLGWAIVDARAKAGDENYLAFLCNARTLFCKVYDFLNPEDDLKKVKERIDEVKEQIANGNPPWSVTRNPLSVKRKPRNRKINQSSNLKIINGEMEETPETKLEDLLMQADLYYNQNNFYNSRKLYESIIISATGNYTDIEYDGTTIENAIYIGLVSSYLESKKNAGNFLKRGIDGIKSKSIEKEKRKKAIEFAKKIVFDNSMRSSLISLELNNLTTSNNQNNIFPIGKSLNQLPYAHPQILKFFANKIAFSVETLDFEKAISYLIEYEKRAGCVPPLMCEVWSALYISCGNTSKAFDVVLNNMTHFGKVDGVWIELMNNLCLQMWSYSTEKDLTRYARVIRLLSFTRYLYDKNGIKNIGSYLFNKRLSWEDEKAEKELTIRQLFKQKKYKEAHGEFVNNFVNSKQPGHFLKLGIIYLKLNVPDMAYDYFTKAYLFRKKHSEIVGYLRNNDPELFYLHNISNRLSIIKWNCYTNFLNENNLTHNNK